MAMNEYKSDFDSRIQSPPKYYIRNMTSDDVQQVLEIWRENGLHEGTHTIQSFLKVDPKGFIVAVDEETGMLSKLSIVYILHNYLKQINQSFYLNIALFIVSIMEIIFVLINDCKSK